MLATTYFNGDKAAYTGQVLQIHGGTFYEVTMLEGIHAGMLKVVTNAPPLTPDQKDGGARFESRQNSGLDY